MEWPAILICLKRFMKVSIGSSIVNGPWGGGNLFIINFKKYLLNKGFKVVHDLSDSDIDIIFLTDPRPRQESSSTFSHNQVERYKKNVNPNALVIQRINECDERKGTQGINNLYIEASKSADHVMFVSTWLQNIYLNLGVPKKKTSVIMAGADSKVFNFSEETPLNRENIKIVTHHWSSHFNKGFETYHYLDNLLSDSEFKNLSFTYIGNIPSTTNFKNVVVKKPLSGIHLANELKKHDIYLTGSVNEPSGNHHIEGAKCGLPILYKKSGGIPEYCTGFGVGFDENFEEALSEIIEDFEIYQKNINNYPFDSESMCDEILSLTFNLLDSKIEIKNRVNFIDKILFLSSQKLFKYFLKLLNIKVNLKTKIKQVISYD